MAITYSLCVACCGSDDDMYNYSVTEVSNDHLIEIENNQNVFNVNEVINISTIIENLQTTVNDDSILITDYISETVSENFLYYYLTVYRLNSNGTVSIYGLTDENLVVSGNSAVIDSESLSVIVNFDGSRFTSNLGLKISEPGTYYISGVQTYYGSIPGKVQIIPVSGRNEGLIINSKIINSNEEDRYVLTIE